MTPERKRALLHFGTSVASAAATLLGVFARTVPDNVRIAGPSSASAGHPDNTTPYPPYDH